MPEVDVPLYAGLFDFDAEAKKEEEKALRLADSQKKIMRTNAIGDAFRLLIDGVGGNAGATITPKGVNPGITGAVSRLDALNKEKEAKLERMRMMDMSNKTRQLQRSQQLADRADDRAKDAEIRSEAELNAINRMGMQQGYNDENADNAAGRAKTAVEDNANQQIRVNSANQDKEVETYQKKVQIGIAVPDYSNIPRNQRATAGDYELQPVGEAEPIYIRATEASTMLNIIMQKYEANNGVGMPQVIRDLKRNVKVNPSSVQQVLLNHWDEVKGVLQEYKGKNSTGPTEEQKRATAHSEAILSVSRNTKLSARQKGKEIERLNEKYDAYVPPATKEVAKPAAEDMIIAPGADGSTDVSNIWKDIE